MSETSLFVGPLLHFLFPNAPEATILAYHGFIRKCAHFGVYFVLAVLAVRALRPMSSLWKFAAATLVVAAIASFDEFNQSFEASRTGSAWDVGLDCVGGAAGIIFATFLYRRFAKEPRQSVS